MATNLTDFTAQTHGFAFENAFPFAFPIEYELPYAGTVALERVVPGLCGGMCYTALDYFVARQARPEAHSAADLSDRFLTYLSERHLDSLSLANVLKIIEWTMMESGENAALSSRLEIPRLRRWLKRGYPAPVVLVRRSGAGSPLENTIVLALGLQTFPGGRRAEIPIYDPNRPGETPLLTMQRLRGAGRIVFTQSTGERLYGFFLLPYTPREVPAELHAALAGVTFAPGLRMPFTLRWPVDSRRVNQEFNVNPAFYRPYGLPGHEGLDLYANHGANIYAAAEGDVTKAEQPKNHPYGLQVRIRHSLNGIGFETIYAHMSQVYVAPGQHVQTGQLLGLANNTGNSFGSHLHFTLKIDGEVTTGFPAGIVDPLPYLQEGAALSTAPVELPSPCGITVYTLLDLNLRAGPGTGTQLLASLPSGERLDVLGSADEARQKIGVQGQWLQVSTAKGTAGYVAAWYVQDTAQAFPPSDLVVYPDNTVNLRTGPGTTFSAVAQLEPTEALTVLGDGELARQKLGKQNEWLQIQTAAGKRGFVAAWLVHTTGQTAPSSGLTVYAGVHLNIRARPDTDSNIITVAVPGDALIVLGNRDQALSAVGVEGKWLQVQTAGEFTGYAAAWFVNTTAPGGQPAPGGTLEVYPVDAINIRAQPSTNSPRVSGAQRGERLEVEDADLDSARKKVGQQNNWLFVQNHNGERGWAAAWYLSLKAP